MMTACYVAVEPPVPHRIRCEPAPAALVQAMLSAVALPRRGPQVARQGRCRERAFPQGGNVCGETRPKMINVEEKEIQKVKQSV
eukprot:1433817-Pyramimonas_sp.AAC.1